MKMNMPVIWVSLLLFSSGFLGEGNLSYSQDRKAEEVIRRSQNFYYSLNDLSVDFSYEVKGVSVRQSTQTGTLQIKKARYILKMKDQETYCDAGKIWVYLPQSNEYMVFSIGEWTYGNIMQLVYSMYFYHADIQYQGMEIMRDGTRTHKIRFRMTDPKINYSTAYAWYDESTNLLSRVIFLDKKKRQRTYTFYNLRYNTSIDNEAFVFHPQNYPGIELRR